MFLNGGCWREQGMYVCLGEEVEEWGMWGGGQ